MGFSGRRGASSCMFMQSVESADRQLPLARAVIAAKFPVRVATFSGYISSQCHKKGHPGLLRDGL